MREIRGSVFRIKNCVHELLAMEDMLDDDDDDDLWELLGRDLDLKSTFLYCDFSQVISHAPEERKILLTDLANRLLYYIQELGEAVKMRSVSLTQNWYNDTAVVLQEVMAIIMPGEISSP